MSDWPGQCSAPPGLRPAIGRQPGSGSPRQSPSRPPAGAKTIPRLTLLAHAERGAGEASRAIETARKAVALWERIAGPDHPGTLEGIDVLAAASLEAGQPQGVAELLERLCEAPAVDPVRRAHNLVKLAELTPAQNKARARERLQAALEMPCWNSDAELSTAERLNLAYTAARAARVFQSLGDQELGLESLRKARSLALQSPNPAAALKAVEAMAAGQPAPR
jgi:hypothetical protein